MTGSSLSSAGLDPRRRRALFRAWRRGTRECDLLLGRFADAYIAALGEAELADFEALLDAPDDDILAWITGRTPVPESHATRVFARLEKFHARRFDIDAP